MQPCLVSGSSCISGIHEFDPFIKTIREMDDVRDAFEDFRSRINNMNVEYPQHTIVPNVYSMVQTMVGPYITDEKTQREFAENIRLTVEAVMPWQKFQSLASLGAGVS